MRELVYLSESKLAQFLPGPRGGWRVRGSVSTPVGSVDVDPVRSADAERARRLERVIDQVARDARWYAEDDLRPGQWIQFEAPLNYNVLDQRYFRRMLVFLEPAGGSVRLLLHGSARHLAGTPSPVRVADSVEDESGYGGGGESGGGGQSSGGYVHLARNVELLIGTMTSADSSPEAAASVPPPSLAAATTRLVAALDAQTYPETAAWMTGYARVTVALRDGGTRYVVASPLNVEHTDPPERP